MNHSIELIRLTNKLAEAVHLLALDSNDLKNKKKIFYELEQYQELRREFTDHQIQIMSYPAEMSCKKCGEQVVKIRGRINGDPKREVCPACLQDRMDELIVLVTQSNALSMEVKEPREPFVRKSNPNKL